MSRKALADLVHSGESQMVKLERGERRLTEDWMGRIARALQVRPADLLGEMAPDLQPSAHNAETPEPAASGYEIEEIDVRAAAGGGAVIDAERANGAWSFPSSWARHEFRARPESLKIITIEGDSMAGTLEAGDKAIINLSKTSPSPPGVFILDDGMGLVAKRLEYEPNSDPPKVRILSDNQRYSTYERTTDEIRIIGRVIWVWRRM